MASGVRASTPGSPPGAAVPGHRRWTAGLPRDLPARLHLLSLAAGGAGLLYLGREVWFYYDEWEFLALPSRALSNLFTPHLTHWDSLPRLSYRALYAAFGLRTDLPYLVVLVAAHLAVVDLVWRLMRRHRVDPWIALGLTVVLLVFGAGAEDLVWPFQVSFVGGLALGLGAVLLVDRRGPLERRTAWACAAGVAAIMCSNVGVVAVAVAALAALLRRRRLVALCVAGVPGAVYVLWFALVGRTAVGPQTPSQLLVFQPLDVLHYAGVGLSTSLRGLVWWEVAGWALLAVIPAAVILLRRVRGRWPPGVALACAAGAVLLFLVSAPARLQFGAEEAASTRYAYLAFALLAPLLGVLLTEVAHRRALVAGLCGLLAAAAAHNLVVLRGAAGDRTALTQPGRERVLEAARLIRGGAPLAPAAPDSVLGLVPDPGHAPALSMDGIRAMLGDGALPDSPSPAARVRLDVAVQVQLSLVPAERAPRTAAPASLLETSGVRVQSSAGGCVVAAPSGRDPTVVLLGHGAAAVAVSGRRDQRLGVELLDGPAPEAARSATRTLTLPRDGVATLVVSLPDAVVHLALLDDAPVTLCAVRR